MPIMPNIYLHTGIEKILVLFVLLFNAPVNNFHSCRDRANASCYGASLCIAQGRKLGPAVFASLNFVLLADLEKGLFVERFLMDDDPFSTK